MGMKFLADKENKQKLSQYNINFKSALLFNPWERVEKKSMGSKKIWNHSGGLKVLIFLGRAMKNFTF